VNDLTTVGVVIDVPEPWCSRLAAVRAGVGDPVADTVPPHLTLLPPTQVADQHLETVRLHLAEVAAEHPPFELHLRGSGTFRPISGVVFVTVARGIAECEVIQSRLRLPPLARELDYPYHPHVTVAHDIDAAGLDAAYDALATFEARFTVDRFTLYQHHEQTGLLRPRQEFALCGDRPGTGPVPELSAAEVVPHG